MGNLAGLDLAAGILAVVGHHADLLSASAMPENGSSLNGKNEAYIFEKFRQSALGLSRHNSYVPRKPSTNASWMSRDELALRELASEYLEDCRLLLEEGESVERSLPREQGSQPRRNSTTSSAAFMLKGRHSMERIEQLVNEVTNYTRSIISSRVAELDKTIETLRGARQYARPENESRIDSMSQDLEDLRLDVRRRSFGIDSKSPAVFSKSDLELFIERLRMLSDVEDSIFADRIVASLNYDSRPVRHDSVPQAHKDTFQWAFDSQLSDWFRSGSGTFWISGKPGSGKSTFMKFIARHPRTKELLAEWAGSADRLAVAAHFFWIAGTPIQKSWQGLLQSLLFDVFHKRPSAVSLISPDRWAAAKAGDWQTAAQPWSVTELAGALRALASADSLPLKMCFFVDGLDEYDSDHAELCDVLNDMAGSNHIKICVSSRPWPVFERGFGGDSKERIDIHELTRNDIHNFVSGQLQSHPRWNISEANSEGSKDAFLVQNIVDKADGVFLWAFFVTRSLQEGLTNGDSTADLHDRLDSLPTDLEQLFKHILESVDLVDHSKMAGILQASAHALEPLHIDLYWQVEREFEEQHYAYRCTLGARPLEQILKQREQTSLSIKEKTKGLLKLVNQRVEFLHRTVKDFVLTREMGGYLRTKLPGDYNGFICIANAYLGLLKTTSQSGSLVAGIVRLGWGLNSGPFISHLNLALMYASEALKLEQSELNHHHQTTELLDRYEMALGEMVRTGHVTIAGCGDQECDPRLPFREELLRHDMTPYIAKRIRQEPEFFDIFDEPPLFAALMPMSRSSGESPAPVPGILDILLRRGGDPNIVPRPRASGIPDGMSPWALFARGTMSVFNILSGPSMFPALRFNDSLNNAIFDLLLSYGADPNACLLDRPGAHSVFSHFLDISLSRFLGEECFDGYLRTLDAFMRAGASLDIPSVTVTEPGSEEAFGNLARARPDESVLVSFCTELKGHLAMLAADPQRAKFVSSVTKRLILHCSGREEYLEEMLLAISAGVPQEMAEPLLDMVESELDIDTNLRKTRKRRRES